MITRVALLRGINVGKAKRIAMADLRRMFEDLGYQDVRTLLNSGNVVFTAPRPGDDAARIEAALPKKLGVGARVTVLSGSEVIEAVRANPLKTIADNPSRLLVVAPRDPRAIARLKPLLRERWAPEALALGKRVAWLWCGRGILGSRLWTAVERALEKEVTARNMATMTKLRDLLE